MTWSDALIEQMESERSARLPREDLAARQRWRDRRLMALNRHKRDAARDIES